MSKDVRVLATERRRIASEYAKNNRDVVLVEPNDLSYLGHSINYSKENELRRKIERNKRPFVLWIGSLQTLKGPLEVIEIARAIPEIDFVMIGSRFDTASSLSIFRRLTEKKSNVHYLGVVSDKLKNDLILKCIAGITTSKYEGFGWVPFEFLTADRPILAYPLDVFREIYGSLITYADDVSSFIGCLAELRDNPHKFEIDPRAVARLRRRYCFSRAASNLVKSLAIKSLVIFTRDEPKHSSTILGCDLVNWNMWHRIHATGVPLHIFAPGTMYSSRFGLTRQTTHFRGWSLRHGRVARFGSTVAWMRDFVNILAAPMSYLYWFARKHPSTASDYVAASGVSTLPAALIVKFLFGSKLLGIVHDVREMYGGYEYNRASFLTRIYLRVYTYSVGRADCIVVFSRTMREALTRVFPEHRKIVLAWGE